MPAFHSLPSFHALTFHFELSVFQFTLTTKTSPLVPETICATTHRMLSGLNRTRDLKVRQFQVPTTYIFWKDGDAHFSKP